MSPDELQAAELLVSLRSSTSGATPAAPPIAMTPQPPPKFSGRGPALAAAAPRAPPPQPPQGLGNPYCDLLLQQVVLSILSRPSVAGDLAHHLKAQLALPAQPPAPTRGSAAGAAPGSKLGLPPPMVAGLMPVPQDWTVGRR